MRRYWPQLLLLGFGGPLMPLAAQEAKKAKEDPAHEELRALKREVTDTVNKNDLDRLLSFLDEDVVVTWQNGEVSRKPVGVRAYYDRMMKGPDRRVDSITINPVVDDLTHLYGDTGVAYGSSEDHFKLTDGKDFKLTTRWSATVVKKNGKWLIVNFHSSTNMFDNPLMSYAIRQTLLWTAVIAVPIGLVLGLVLIRLLRRRKPATP
jgi:ketosteroid isomerase-like protein